MKGLEREREKKQGANKNGFKWIRAGEPENDIFGK